MTTASITDFLILELAAETEGKPSSETSLCYSACSIYTRSHTDTLLAVHVVTRFQGKKVT